jgi:hypothetical protein
MGWKAAAILIWPGPGPLMDAPRHEPDRAADLLARWDPRMRLTTEAQFLRDVLNPSRGQHYIGTFDGLIVVASWELTSALFGDEANRKIVRSGVPGFQQALLQAHPEDHILGIVLHSVVNLWGLALFQNGRVQRIAAGAADDGWIVNEGPERPEEPFRPATFTLPEDGEDVALAATARVFSQRLDDPAPHWCGGLPMQRFTITRPGLLSRLFGR